MWVAAGSATLPLLYPMSGWFAVLAALPLPLGLSSSLGLAASQTWSMQASHGDTAMLARYSVFSRIGTFFGPVIAGAAWDLSGPWAAFACVALCGAGIMAAAARGLPHDARPSLHAKTLPTPRVLAVLVPRWEEHRQAIALAA